MKITSSKVLFLIVAIAISVGLYYYYRVPPKINLMTLEFENLEGNKIENKSLQRELVVLSFYKSWCGPCIGEMNSLKDLSTDFKDEVLVLCVSDENIEKQKAVAARFSSGNLYFLNTKKTFKEIGIHTFPTNYIIRKDGCVLYEKTAPDDWSSEEIRTKIKNWLRE
jgi:thiol-disulfide isomerase/thioredoxin